MLTSSSPVPGPGRRRPAYPDIPPFVGQFTRNATQMVEILEALLAHAKELRDARPGTKPVNIEAVRKSLTRLRGTFTVTAGLEDACNWVARTTPPPTPSP